MKVDEPGAALYTGVLISP